MSRTVAVLASGKTTFAAICAPCHAANAGGYVGPTLTDAYWIHGSDPANILRSVRDGWVGLIGRLAPERPDAKIAPEAALALLDHDWPLNVRELEQALAGALALSGLGAIERAHLPARCGVVRRRIPSASSLRKSSGTRRI